MSTEVNLPDTPAGRQLDWVLGGIRTGGVTPPIADLEAHFNSTFLRAMAAEDLQKLFDHLREQIGEGSISQIVDSDFHDSEDFEPSDHELVVGWALGKVRLRVSIAVEESEPHKISGLYFRPAPELMEEPLAGTWEEVQKGIESMAERTNLLAAEVVGDELSPIYSFGEDSYLAIGSTFKLWVLGALGEAVGTGEVSWEDEVEVVEEWKSIPSGVLQDEEAGTKVSVEEAATKMISISDNTATDLLMRLVGREACEDYMRESRHSRPELNLPFLMTREISVLKLGFTQEARDDYVGMDESLRRKFLQEEVSRKPLPEVEHEVKGWEGGRNIADIEWFANPYDLARTMVALRGEMAHPALSPLRQILSTNPGLPLNRSVWIYVAYKGGGEPGVLSFTWLLMRRDLRWFVLTLTLNDDSGEVDRWDAIAYALAALKLLGEHVPPPTDENLV